MFAAPTAVAYQILVHNGYGVLSAMGVVTWFKKKLGIPLEYDDDEDDEDEDGDDDKDGGQKKKDIKSDQNSDGGTSLSTKGEEGFLLDRNAVGMKGDEEQGVELSKLNRDDASSKSETLTLKKQKGETSDKSIAEEHFMGELALQNIPSTNDTTLFKQNMNIDVEL